MDTIRLHEYTPQEVELTPEDAAFISTELSKRISISRHVSLDLYVLNPAQYVGVVSLPSGRRIESSPKVDLQNLFHMLAVAFELESPFRPQTSLFNRLDELFEFVAEYFVELVENRISSGLHRSYVTTQENLTKMRGRISFAEDLRQNYVLRHRTFCEFSEFTWDIPENQIVRQVAHMLSGWTFRPRVRHRLARIDAALAEVRPTRMPATAINGFKYHRLNDDYRQLHQLCRLFLEGASLSEDFGTFNFRTFLIDMNQLFEAFVTQVLKESARHPMTVSAQTPVYLACDKTRKQKVRMRPDIMVSAHGAPVLVADCKYKKVDLDEYKNHDMYQLLAYCTATGVDSGLLIYPRHVVELADELRIRRTNIAIRLVTVDLGGTGEELELECRRFSDEVFSQAEMPPSFRVDTPGMRAPVLV